MRPGGKPRLSSSLLTLQILLYFGGWWDVFFFALNILIFIYKGVVLPYPSRNFEIEFCFTFLWILIEPGRLFYGSKGNKSEKSGPLVASILLSLPLFAFYVYYLMYQTYVLKIDQFLNAIGLAFLGLQVLLSLFAIMRFSRTSRTA